ncbi:MAG: RDD family protein [Chrysiogenetes bacterium]|nr:RDD family protein [Chrysiogenetes bacterium]
MFCIRCGSQNEAGAQYCSSCGNPLGGGVPAQAPEGALPQDPGGAALQAPLEYAGFWRRFVAWLIDMFLLGIVLTPVQKVLFHYFGVDPAMVESLSLGVIPDLSDLQDLGSAWAKVNLISFVLAWPYFALMQSSVKQATLGKMALGIKVADENGDRISMPKATARYFSKFVSQLILYIGYLMAAFTGRKQALHDKLAGTLVIRARD